MNTTYYDNYIQGINGANDYLKRFFNTIGAGDYMKLTKNTTCYMLKVDEAIGRYNDDESLYDITIKGVGLEIEYTDTTRTTISKLKYSSKITVENIITSNTVNDSDDYIIEECDNIEMAAIVNSLKL